MHLRRIIARIGRRGASLLFLGLLDLVIATSLIVIPPEVQASAGFLFVGDLLPLTVWGAIWAAVGVLCLVQAFMRMDRVAYAAATLLKCVYGLLYLIGFATGEIPRGYVSAVIWLGFAAWLAVLSTWPEAIRLAPDSVGADYPDAVITADEQGRITGWQGSAAAMFGWTREEAVGQPVAMLMPARYRALHTRGITRVAQTRQSPLAGQTLDAYALDRDGHEFPVQVLIGVVDAPGGIRFSTVIRDLRRRR